MLAHKGRHLLPHRDGSVARVVWSGADPADLLVREIERLEGILSRELTFVWATASQDAWTARGIQDGGWPRADRISSYVQPRLAARSVRLVQSTERSHRGGRWD